MFVAIVAGMRGAELPFAFDTRDGQWKEATVQKTAAPGITVERVVAHVAGAERLIVLSSPLAAGDTESLGDFGRRVRASFTGYRSSGDVTEREASHLDYAGRTLTFDLSNAKETLDVELFVFADGNTRWAVLHSKTKSAVAAVVPAAFSLLQKKTAKAPGVVGLDPFRVKSDPVTGFPIAFRIEQGAGSNRIKEILVTQVPEGSSTEKAGVKVGDKIVSVNGRKTQDFSVGAGKESELGRIFLNRQPGDEVTLELIAATNAKSYKVTLRVPPPSSQLGVERFSR